MLTKRDCLNPNDVGTRYASIVRLYMNTNIYYFV